MRPVISTNSAFDRTAYRRHNTYVKARCPKAQLLVFNVKNGWDPLCEFLGEERSKLGDFPHINKNGEINADNLGFETLATLRKTMLTQLVAGLLMKFSVVALIAIAFFLV